ncbi:putative HAF family extracellular repeat protein [Rhizobium aquaticum]|uniref:HAF family extracellular repeat protein n=1 Tax=Rhizobium aquaticum TaxID=1549636 RepID=A0ABV2J524_9HYPH
MSGTNKTIETPKDACHEDRPFRRANTSDLTLRPYRSLLLALLAGVPVFMPMGAHGSDLLGLGTINGGANSYGYAVSADGTVVVGEANDGSANNVSRAFRWSQSSGLISLGLLNGGRSSEAYGVSADGAVVVGYAGDGAANNASRAFRWTQGSGMVSLGVLNGGNGSSANGVSADGSVVVGYAADGTANNKNRAFRWTQQTGLVSLGTLNRGAASIANAASADGSVVVGYSNDGAANNRDRAFRWTQASGLVSLGVLNGGFYSYANSVSGDGSVVVGNATDGAAANSTRAYRWTQSAGMVSLGALNRGSMSAATGASADGAVVVGYATDGANNDTRRAFRWTQGTGLITVDQWLRNNGVTLPNDVTLEADGVSADGSVVAGTLASNRAFIARGPVPLTVSPSNATAAPTATTTTAGLMDVTNFQQSLVSAPRVSGQLQNADVAINGAHSSPLFMLLDAGQSSAWFTGDGGYSSMKSSQGGIGAGEFGFGRGIEGGWTVRVAVGGQYARMDTPNAGNSVFSSGYVAPDVSYAAGGGVVATLSGYFNWGKADIRRGYLNGAANDSSFGSAATQTYGVRARVDWQDAFKLASTGVSPFVSYTYLNSQMNGYTETGGSFPVQFNGSREVSNAVRIGADATTPLNDQFALVTRFEYGHRFEKAGAGVSGQILGLSAFSIDGASVQQDWLRGGLGMSYKLGNGDGLVMVNTSNQTGKNTTWVSASYRVKF